jgi:hypothetical protein
MPMSSLKSERRRASSPVFLAVVIKNCSCFSVMKWKQEHCFFSDGLVDIFNQPSKNTFAETPHAGIILFGCKGYFSAARFESSTPVSLLTKN